MDAKRVLEGRNRCLKRLIGATEHFLNEAANRNWQGLDRLVQRRQLLVNILELYGRQLEALTIVEAVDIPGLLAERDLLVQKLNTVDRELFTKLDQERVRIKEDLQRSRKGREAVSKFKSGSEDHAAQILDEKL